MKRQDRKLIYYAAVCLAVVGAACPKATHAAHLDRETFSLTRLRPLVEDTTIPFEERLEQAIEFLRQELESPSKPSWGVGGGPIDAGYIQGVIIGVIAFPGSEDPALLRRFRDEAETPRLKDLLTISLGLTGAQDTIPALLRIARNDPEGSIRRCALQALGTSLRPPRPTEAIKRLRPGEVWKPLDARVQQTVRNALIAGLSDPHKQYMGLKQSVEGTYYPVQVEARQDLRLIGYKVEAVPQGWRVQDETGRMVTIVKLSQEQLQVRAAKEKRRQSSPPGLHDAP